MGKLASGAIVKSKIDGQLYEITEVFGTVVLARPVKEALCDPELKGKPIKLDDCEVVLDSPNDAFNILFDDE